MERESGYYHVKYQNEWSVAEWVKGNDYSLSMWHTLYTSAMLNEDSDFDEIDERRIVRGETKAINIDIQNFLEPAELPSEENRLKIIEFLQKSPLVTDEYKQQLKDGLKIDTKCEGLINDIKSCVPLMRNPPLPPISKRNEK